MSRAQALQNERTQRAIDAIGELLLAAAGPEQEADVDAIMVAIIRLVGVEAALDDE